MGTTTSASASLLCRGRGPDRGSSRVQRYRPDPIPALATLDAVKFLDSQTSFRRRRSIVSRVGTFLLQVLRRLSLFLRLRIDS